MAFCSSIPQQPKRPSGAFCSHLWWHAGQPLKLHHHSANLLNMQIMPPLRTAEEESRNASPPMSLGHSPNGLKTGSQSQHKSDFALVVEEV